MKHNNGPPDAAWTMSVDDALQFTIDQLEPKSLQAVCDFLAGSLFSYAASKDYN